MQRWKEEFVVNNQRKCVHVHHNGDFEHGKVLYMEADWTYLDFLNAASMRLNMAPAAKRAFNADGVEIDDCMMIEDDDILFLSMAEDFTPPADLETPDDPNRAEGDKIPHNIGGYKVGELLGRGGFGEVRVGEHHLTGERVALKFLRKAEIHSFNAAERTNTEIQCLTALKHGNIIRLLHHTETQNHVVLIFELMEGGDLSQFLSKRKQASPLAKACLTEEEARQVFYQVLSAVSYAHNQHICHRDLKLENILLKDQSLNMVKIADFGLSDFYRPGALVKSNCGTLSFLAPEVFKGTANAGPPLDVWAMGVILFALLCGRLPFEGPDLVGTKRPRDAVIKARIMKCQYKIDEQLGPEAKDLVRRMLQSDPSERITIPEIFNHIWVRTTNPSQLNDMYYYREHQTAPSNATTLGHGSSTSDVVKSVLMNTTAMNSLDLLIPISPNHAKNRKQLSFNKSESLESNNSIPSLTGSRKNSATFLESPSISSKHLGLATVHEKDGLTETDSSLPGKLNFAKMGSNPNMSNSSSGEQISTGRGGNNSLDHISPKESNNVEVPEHNGLGQDGKPTIKLIPLRRSTSNKDVKSKLQDDDDDDNYVLRNLALHDPIPSQAPIIGGSRGRGKDDQQIGLSSGAAAVATGYRPSTTVLGRKQNSVNKDMIDDDSSVGSINSTNTHHNKSYLTMHAKKDANSPLISVSVNASPRAVAGGHDNRRGTVTIGAEVARSLQHGHVFSRNDPKKDKEKEKYSPSTPQDGKVRTPSSSGTNSNFSPSAGSRVRSLN